MSYLADIDSDRALTPLQAASCTYRIALGPRAGQKVLSLQAVPGRPVHATQALCANAHGFSWHAAVRCGADQRMALEHLCRYITRPAIANERLKRNRVGQVVLQLKSPYRDGTTHIEMSPLEFMQRLAALVPHPRLHLIPASMACSHPTPSCGPRSFRAHRRMHPHWRMHPSTQPITRIARRRA